MKHRRSKLRRRTLRKTKARRSTRRHRQRGGDYEVADATRVLEAADNFGESKNMYEEMERPCIHPDYPRYAETVRRGQNQDNILVKHYMVLISDNQDSYNNEQNKERDMIFIDMIVEDNTFIKAFIVLVKEDDEDATPADLLESIEEAASTRRVVPLVMNPATRAIHQPAYEALLESLRQTYKKEGDEEGVQEC